MPKAVYKSEKANRVDARFVNHVSKKVMTIEMSCPWISNREKKSEEKTMKYGPLRWELKEQFKGYDVHQYNIIMDVLGGWSKETEISWAKDYSSLRENAKGSFIGDVEHCKNFQNSNMLMLMSRLIN